MNNITHKLFIRNPKRCICWYSGHLFPSKKRDYKYEKENKRGHNINDPGDDVRIGPLFFFETDHGHNPRFTNYKVIIHFTFTTLNYLRKCLTFS